MENDEKAIYGLIGYPLTHSFSKTYFNQKFESENINAEYVNFEIPDISFFSDILLKVSNIKGCNVTIPYKEKVIPYLDELDEAADAVGAVNVIKFVDDFDEVKLVGYNSDIIGFSDSIEPILEAKDKYALILGTGGASKAVAYALNELGIKLTFVSRNKKGDDCITYEDLDEAIMKKNTIIVNTTPLGMYPHVENAPNIPYHLLDESHLCYDLIYNPDETKFMKLAKERGARVKNGLEMLLLQAFASWNIWNS